MSKQLEHPVALTVPFIFEQEVLIGMYCHVIGSACIDVNVDQFKNIKDFLYNLKSFRLLVHGIRQIWLNHDIRDPKIIVNAIWDALLTNATTGGT